MACQNQRLGLLILVNPNYSLSILTHHFSTQMLQALIDIFAAGETAKLLEIKVPKPCCIDSSRAMKKNTSPIIKL
jgi:hypothetical protein